MKKLEIFGRERTYDFTFEIDADIKVLRKLKEEIKKPLILSYTGFDLIRFDVDDDTISDRMLWWLYEAKNKGDDIRSFIEKCSIEDTVWTAERNKNYTYTVYKKIKLDEHTVEFLEKELNEHLEELEEILKVWELEKAKEKKQKEEEKERWEVIEVLKDIKPSGGEMGSDGYYDAIYRQKSTGGECRMVSRDIFDFGLFSYPKRMEGSKDIFNEEKLTEAEKSLRNWIAEFGIFKNKSVRM